MVVLVVYFTLTCYGEEDYFILSKTADLTRISQVNYIYGSFILSTRLNQIGKDAIMWSSSLVQERVRHVAFFKIEHRNWFLVTKEQNKVLLN